MRAAVLEGRRRFVVEERPDPEPTPGCAVVRIEAVGVCGTDSHFWEHGGVADLDALGLVLGHEAAGVVEAVADDVTGVEPGDRVAIEPGVPDRSCAACDRGDYHLCNGMRYLGTPEIFPGVGPVDGAFQELLCHPARHLFRIPDSMDFETAALVEPLAVAVASARQGGVGPETDVVVTGAGALGLVAAQAALAVGARTVTIAARPSPRLELAATMGVATTTSGDLASGTADVVLETTGRPDVIEAAMPVLRRGGHLVLAGGGTGTAALPLFSTHVNEWHVSGVFRFSNVYPAAIAYAASGRVDLGALVTDRCGLDGLQAAMERDDPRHVKTILTPAATS